MSNILVVGAGAIGCFVGGRLAASNQRVTLLGRPALMEKIAADGLLLRQPGRPDQQVFPATATALDALTAHFDFILVSVKAPDTPQVIEQLAASQLSLESSTIVSLQNGVGNEEALASTFETEHVLAGTVTIPIDVPDLGVIEVSKDKGGLGLAALQPAQPIQALVGHLELAGFTAWTYEDYRAMKWSKLLLNIFNNASAAILNLPPAQIIADPGLFDMEIEAVREGVAVMKAQGLDVVRLPGYPVDWLARIVSAGWLPPATKRVVLRPFVISGRGTKMPSLQIDLAAGRSSSEVEVLNGAIVKAGQKFDIATPVNQALTDILTGLVSRRLAWADYQQQPEKLLRAVTVAKRGLG